LKEQRRKDKEHLKKKFRDKSSCGTTSADASQFPNPTDLTSHRSGGSAPSGSKMSWNAVLLDPLDSSYVARNGQQVLEKASSWDWNTGEDPGNEEISAAHPIIPSPISHPPDDDGNLLIKGDVLKSDYFGTSTLEDGDEDYNFSENYLNNTHEASLATPYLVSPPHKGSVVFPAISSSKSKLSEPGPPSSLSVSFAQMISSHSRPNIPMGNIPSVVEKALKRKKSSQLKKKEEKK
jgi:hypothetical protein